MNELSVIWSVWLLVLFTVCMKSMTSNLKHGREGEREEQTGQSATASPETETPQKLPHSKDLQLIMKRINSC